jgi:hypothetical protein
MGRKEEDWNIDPLFVIDTGATFGLAGVSCVIESGVYAHPDKIAKMLQTTIDFKTLLLTISIDFFISSPISQT